MKPRVATIHFNKRMSGKGLPWTVHLSDRCIATANVVIEVPTETVYRPHRKTNPRAWIRARGRVQINKDSVRIF